MAPLLKAAEVAKDLGCSKQLVYKMAREGELPYVPVGRNVRFRPEAIEQWIAEQEEGGSR
jgi:excisionase family DNA binding protein